MALAGSATPRPVRLLWAVVCLSLVVVLGALGFGAWHLPPPADDEGPEEASLEERIEAIDVVRASDVLSERLSEARSGLDAALLPGGEETLVQLLRLQADAASVQLGPVRFEPRSRDGFIQAVVLELEVSGAYYDLPIFLDGFYRQRHAVEIRRITIEADGPLDVRVMSRVEVRLYRPVEIPADGLRATMPMGELGASDRGFATTALLDAARLEAYERFIEQVPELRKRSSSNRRLVMRTIPRLIRKLPASPMDWVGATFEGGEAHLATEAP